MKEQGSSLRREYIEEKQKGSKLIEDKEKLKKKIGVRTNKIIGLTQEYNARVEYHKQLVAEYEKIQESIDYQIEIKETPEDFRKLLRNGNSPKQFQPLKLKEFPVSPNSVPGNNSNGSDRGSKYVIGFGKDGKLTAVKSKMEN